MEHRSLFMCIYSNNLYPIQAFSMPHVCRFERESTPRITTAAADHGNFCRINCGPRDGFVGERTYRFIEIRIGVESNFWYFSSPPPTLHELSPEALTIVITSRVELNRVTSTFRLRSTHNGCGMISYMRVLPWEEIGLNFPLGLVWEASTNKP